MCYSNCLARKSAERVLTRMKQKMGQQLAKHEGTVNRKWFSRGWDIKPVRDQARLDYLLNKYLPDREQKQAGLFRRHS